MSIQEFFALPDGARVFYELGDRCAGTVKATYSDDMRDIEWDDGKGMRVNRSHGAAAWLADLRLEAMAAT